MDDFTLLKEYARTGSEEAFGQLVSRHIATVFSAARRQIGEDSAADVTQAVFVLLARKASKIRAGTVQAAWLLTTTRLVCRATFRKERRRQKREQEAANMPIDYEQIEIQSAWDQVQPMLDEAMAALPERDRNLVALRFFEKKSHAEIAASLSLSEEVSKKRLSRAVERLRKFFLKRGVTVVAVTFLAAISQNAVQAAPAGLAQTVTAIASGGLVGGTVATLVQGSLKLMTSIKIKIAAISAAAALFIVGAPIVATMAAADSKAVKAPNGRRVTLERYEFTNGSVRYRYPASAPQPGLYISTPTFPGDKMLSAEFSWQVGPEYPRLAAALRFAQKKAPSSWSTFWTGYPGASAIRVVTADEQGNEFDPDAQNLGMFEQYDGREYVVEDVPVFPRRGKSVRLRLLDNGVMLGEFTIPNPVPGPYPEWAAQILPINQAAGDLEVALTRFRSIHPGTNRGKDERTECVFSLREAGRETAAWAPASFEILDATGNHWGPPAYVGANPYPVNSENGSLRTEFLGALWPGESAWKLRCEFKRVADFPKSELLEITKIQIPADGKFSEPHTRYEWNGATVEVAGVIGKDADRQHFLRTHSYLLANAERRKGCVTVALSGNMQSKNRRLNFISATDDRGRQLTLAGFGRGDSKWSPYSLVLKTLDDSHELNVVVAVSESRFVDFLARPEQIHE